MGDRKWINGKKGSNRKRKSKDSVECKTSERGEKERDGGGVVLEGIEEEERETAGAGIKV